MCVSYAEHRPSGDVMTIAKPGLRNSFEGGPGSAVPLRSIWLQAGMILRTQGGAAQPLHCCAPPRFFATSSAALQAIYRKSANATEKRTWCVIKAGNTNSSPLSLSSENKHLGKIPETLEWAAKTQQDSRWLRFRLLMP